MPITRSENPRRQSANLLRAYAISIAIHVLALWSVTPAEKEVVPSVPLVVSLRPSVVPVAPPGPATALPALHQRTKPQPPKPQALVADRDEKRRAKTNTITETTSVETGSESPGLLVDSVPAMLESNSAPASALPSSAGIDAEGLRRFRLALAREIRRHKRYPVRAEQAGWTGTVVLRVKVGVAGPLGVELAKSSGYGELDDAALEMLRRALPATSLPASLRERAFAVDLPVVFELTE